MINSKEQEKRKLDRMVDNLVATLAELPEGLPPKTILEKIRDLEGQREQLAQALLELRDDRKRKGGGKVINTEHVFRVFRLFQRDFPTRPAHEQREILRSVVSKVVVQENGLRVFYYGTPREDKLLESSPDAIEAKLLGTPAAVPTAKSQKKDAKAKNSGSSFDGTGVRAVSGVVDRAGHWANRPQLADFIALPCKLSLIPDTEIRTLREGQQLTADQISETTGLSKPQVLRRLHRMNIRREVGTEIRRGPQHVPFGLRLVSGHLREHRRETRVARLIVELRQRQGLPWEGIVQKLNAAGLRTREGNEWGLTTVARVFKRWRGKL